MNTENIEAIQRDTEQLGRDIQEIGASMYSQGQPGGPQAGGPDGAGSQGGPEQQPGSQGSSGEDVVDGEFRNA